jgi:hypothetical protein
MFFTVKKDWGLVWSGNIFSCSVKIRLHRENQLPRLPGVVQLIPHVMLGLLVIIVVAFHYCFLCPSINAVNK